MAVSFSPDIHARIAAAVARIQSDWLEWSAESTTGDFDTKIVETLVETLDAHARGYLEGMDGTGWLPEYRSLLREVGAALVKNTQTLFNITSFSYGDNKSVFANI